MSFVLPSPIVSVVGVPRGTLAPIGTGHASMGAFRLPSDPIFHATLTLRNAVVGSRYRVTRADNGAELAVGVVASAVEGIAAVPCFANPMLVNIAVRQGTAAPKYLPYTTQTEVGRSGGVAFIAQVPDPIA